MKPNLAITFDEWWTERMRPYTERGTQPDHVEFWKDMCRLAWERGAVEGRLATLEALHNDV